MSGEPRVYVTFGEERWARFWVAIHIASLGKPIQATQLCQFNPLNAELIPIRHLLALVGAHHILHVNRARDKLEMHIDGFVS